jgi:hypothetical protein
MINSVGRTKFLLSSPIRDVRGKYETAAGHRKKEDMNTCYRILVGNPEGRGLLGRPRRKWDDNIRMDLKVRVWQVVDWIGASGGLL